MSTLSSILSAFLGQLPRSIIVSMVLLCAGAVAQDGPRSDKPQTIVFVCLHGSVKSQVAAAHFNRIAKERGLPLVAVSRGIAVDPNIPASIRQGLAADGLVPPNTFRFLLHQPTQPAPSRFLRLMKSRMIAKARGRLRIGRTWPPATKDYVAARDAIVRHIEEAMTSLGKK